MQQVDALLPEGDLALAVKANLAVMLSADEQSEILERTVIQRVQLRPQFRFLKTVPGSGVRLLLLNFLVQLIDLSSKRLVLGDPRGESSDKYSHRCRVPPKISRHFAQCVSLPSNQ